MPHSSNLDIEIDRTRVARCFYWRRFWFLLPKWGWPLAQKQAEALRYFVSDSVLHAHGGILWYRRAAIPLARITNVELTQNPLDRLFGIWILKVHTAGQRMHQFPEAVIYGPCDGDAARELLGLPSRDEPANRSGEDAI